MIDVVVNRDKGWVQVFNLTKVVWHIHFQTEEGLWVVLSLNPGEYCEGGTAYLAQRRA